MLRLKNIKINSEVAEADFYPEDSETKGHIVVNLHTREIQSIQHVPGYEFMYPGHARHRLVEMAKEHDESSESLVMWY